MESLIYSGLELKLNSGFLKRFLKSLQKKVGDNPYIFRINEVINFFTPAAENDPEEDLKEYLN